MVHHAMLGMTELLIILAIVVLLFGAGRLPQIGEALGKTLQNFKRATRADLPPRDR